MIYNADKARSIAARCQADDHDWKYEAEVVGNFGRVAVRDSEGVFLGYLGEELTDASGSAHVLR